MFIHVLEKLPWVKNTLNIMINKVKRLHWKRKISPQQIQKNSKRTLQRDMQNAYRKYIEKMIFDPPLEEPDDNIRQKQPKNLFT